MWLWWFLLWLWRSCDSPHPPHLPLCLVMYWWTCACLLVVAVRGAFATTMPAELVYRRVVHTVYASRCCHDLDAVVAFTALANPVTRLLIGLWPSCRSLCLLRPTNPVPHDLSAGRCLGNVWYHCDITMATLGLSTQALDTLSLVLALPLSLQKRFCKVGCVLLYWLPSVTPR